MPLIVGQYGLVPQQVYAPIPNTTLSTSQTTAYQNICGQVCEFTDQDLVAGTITVNSNISRRAVFVQNTSGGTLAAGQALNWVSGQWKTQVQACPQGQVPRCFVPGYINGSSSNTIPNNAFFWAYTNGPTSVLSDGTATIATGSNLVVGASAAGKIRVDTSVANPLYTSLTAPSTSLTAQVATAFSNGAYTFPANTFVAGDTVRFRAQVNVPSIGTTPTLTVQVFIGAQAIMTTGAISVVANDNMYIDGEFTIYTAGASGTMGAVGTSMTSVSGTTTTKQFFLSSSTAVNTTVAQTVSVQGTWSVTGCSALLEVFDLIRDNPLPPNVSAATSLASLGATSTIVRADLYCPW